MEKVMAIILNYNSIEDSKKCTEYLQKQQGIDLEIVIVDNCSNDGKIEELQEFGREKNVKIIANTENKGYSAGNNIGLKYATAQNCRYALIINPDMEIRDQDYIFKAVSTMKEDNNIAVLGTCILNAKNQHQNPMREVSLLEEIFWPWVIIRNKINRKTLPYICNYKKSGYCDKVSGCCFFISVSFAEKIGYLDENTFLYCEEPILAAMVKREGYKEYYLHDAMAYHMHIESEKGDPIKRRNMFLKSRTYYLNEYSGYCNFFKKLTIGSNRIQNKIMNKN